MSAFFSDFKAFINRGNVIDLAVGVIIGSAFTSIINSLVNDIFTPLISLFTGDVAFSSLTIPVGEDVINLGNFVNACIQFLIVAFAVFFMVRGLGAAQKRLEAASNQQHKIAPHCPYCLEEVKEGATRCPHCAAAFDAPAAPTVAPVEVPDDALSGLWRKAREMGSKEQTIV